MERVALWVFCPLAAGGSIAGFVLLGIGHGSEALACGAVTAGAGIGMIVGLLLKWRPNTTHKGDGHDA